MEMDPSTSKCPGKPRTHMANWSLVYLFICFMVYSYMLICADVLLFLSIERLRNACPKAPETSPDMLSSVCLASLVSSRRSMVICGG